MSTYLRTSGALFGLIALLHIVRLSLHWPAQVADWIVPFWLSWVAVLVPATLSIWAFRLVRQAPRLS